jgi:hypothetical protein
MTDTKEAKPTKPSRVLVVMSENDCEVAGVLSEEPSIQLEVVWTYTEWKDIPRGYKTLARMWGFRPDDAIDD